MLTSWYAFSTPFTGSHCLKIYYSLNSIYFCCIIEGGEFICLSNIDGFLLNSLSEEGIHLLPISHHINVASELFLQILFYSDKIQCIQSTEGDYYIDIAFLISAIPYSRSEKA